MRSNMIELGLELAGERSPVRLVETFCRGAQQLVSAKRAAVGILDGGGALEHIVIRGMDAKAGSEFESLLPAKGALGERGGLRREQPRKRMQKRFR
jgi:hypothetical protein